VAESKEMEVSAEKYIARNSPVRIWTTKHSPLRDPNLQKEEIFLGAGRETRWSHNLPKVFCFRKGLIITIVSIV
jgi:hypothetical protein